MIEICDKSSVLEVERLLLLKQLHPRRSSLIALKLKRSKNVKNNYFLKCMKDKTLRKVSYYVWVFLESIVIIVIINVALKTFKSPLFNNFYIRVEKLKIRIKNISQKNRKYKLHTVPISGSSWVEDEGRLGYTLDVVLGDDDDDDLWYILWRSDFEAAMLLNSLYL